MNKEYYINSIINGRHGSELKEKSKKIIKIRKEILGKLTNKDNIKDEINYLINKHKEIFEKKISYLNIILKRKEIDQDKNVKLKDKESKINDLNEINYDKSLEYFNLI